MTVTTDIVSGRIVEEEIELTLDELCQACGVDAPWLMTLVEEGILDPQQTPHPGVQQIEMQLRFSGLCVQRVRTVYRLQRDLGINLAGAALALDLLEEIDALKARMAALNLDTDESS